MFFYESKGTNMFVTFKSSLMKGCFDFWNGWNFDIICSDVIISEAIMV